MSRTRRRTPFQAATMRARRPAWQRTACRDCGRAVIVAEEDTGGGRLKGAVIEGSAALYGVLVRTIDGGAGAGCGLRAARHPVRLAPLSRPQWLS